MGDQAPAHHRPDIQAMRALAVASVVAYHLWPHGLTGGFVGVDVFFVISGFLITGHLAREAEQNGRIRLGRFWARRARRLLPAAYLVLAVVGLGIATWGPLSQRPGGLRDVLASALYGENWALAGRAVDYLHASDAPSPVQHFWSLSVEEQFYIGLPLIMLAVMTVVRRRGAVPVVLAGLTVASLVYGALLTRAQPGAAYFSTFGRAWEFLLGGLLGGYATRLPRSRLIGLAGLVAVLWAMLRFDTHTAFPGLAAIVPVLGAAALLSAADRSPLALAARLRPVTWLGDVSYSAYLWHWPMVVLVPDATGHALTDAERLGIVAATLVLAGLSARFVEDPLRRAGAWRAPLRTAAVVATAMAVVTVATLGTAHAADERLAELRSEAARLLASTDIGCLGAAAEAGRAAPCPDLGSTLVPDPSVAGLDDHNSGACWASTDPVPHVCHRGSTAPGAFRVLAVGDSHNNMYLPWFEHLAAARGWSVDVTGHAGCTWGSRPQHNQGADNTAACTAWKQNIAHLLASRAPYDLILTTQMRADGPVPRRPGETQLTAAAHSAQEAWQSQISRGSVVVALADTPRASGDVVACVEQHRTEPDPTCGRPQDEAYDGHDALEQAVQETPGSRLLDVRDLVCTTPVCPTVVHHVVVYRDPSHLTQTFVHTLIPVLDHRLTRLLRQD